jgi:hypothetical protein
MPLTGNSKPSCILLHKSPFCHARRLLPPPKKTDNAEDLVARVRTRKSNAVTLDGMNPDACLVGEKQGMRRAVPRVSIPLFFFAGPAGIVLSCSNELAGQHLSQRTRRYSSYLVECCEAMFLFVEPRYPTVFRGTVSGKMFAQVERNTEVDDAGCGRPGCLSPPGGFSKDSTTP